MTCTEDVRTGAFWEVSLFKKEEQWQQTTRHGQTRGAGNDGAVVSLHPWCLFYSPHDFRKSSPLEKLQR